MEDIEGQSFYTVQKPKLGTMFLISPEKFEKVPKDGFALCDLLHLGMDHSLDQFDYPNKLPKGSKAVLKLQPSIRKILQK